MFHPFTTRGSVFQRITYAIMLPFYKCIRILLFYVGTMIIKVINLLAVHRRQGHKTFQCADNNYGIGMILIMVWWLYSWTAWNKLKILLLQFHLNLLKQFKPGYSTVSKLQFWNYNVYNFISFKFKNPHSYLKFNTTSDIINLKKQDTLS